MKFPLFDYLFYLFLIEKTEISIEQLFDHNLIVFLSDATFVCALFALEFHPFFKEYGSNKPTIFFIPTLNGNL